MTFYGKGILKENRKFPPDFPRNFPEFPLTKTVPGVYNILRGMLRSGWFSASRQGTLWHLWDAARCRSVVEIGETANGTNEIACRVVRRRHCYF